MKLLNSDFSDIWDDPSNPLDGGCFVSTSDFDFTDRSIQVGNGAASGSCNFNNSISGIIGNGEMNYKIEKNIFGIGDGTNKILNYCIKISNNGEKEILIENVNKFYDYKHGIDISAPEGKIYVRENTFYNTFFNGSTNFEGTAINVYSPYPIKLYGSEISDNLIGNSSQQARIGIHMSNIEKIGISGNEIYFNHSSAPTDMFSGIYLQNCNNARLEKNKVENVNATHPVGSHTFLTGLRIHSSNNTCIENSELKNLGHSMEFEGESVVNSLFQNIITNFDTAIF
ncbi:MAG: hypothetical protein IPK10_12105 [Bacteroidetes bacterium]|nr:hypothetical protein [Bacteroidota bacterium]